MGNIRVSECGRGYKHALRIECGTNNWEWVFADVLDGISMEVPLKSLDSGVSRSSFRFVKLSIVRRLRFE